jgi:hypothetical protein
LHYCHLLKVAKYKIVFHHGHARRKYKITTIDKAGEREVPRFCAPAVDELELSAPPVLLLLLVSTGLEVPLEELELDSVELERVLTPPVELEEVSEEEEEEEDDELE